MKRGPRALDTLDDDIRDHIERETQDNVDRGMTPDEARRQAVLAFGNLALAKEDTRAVWGWGRLEQLAHDIWYAIRILRRRPVYALLSVLTLALGVGGTASVYGVAHGVLLSPLPYAHERELGVFWMKTDWTTGLNRCGTSPWRRSPGSTMHSPSSSAPRRASPRHRSWTPRGAPSHASLPRLPCRKPRQ